MHDSIYLAINWKEKTQLNLLLLVNKRLDEWVTPDRLDMKKLQFPKKEAKTPMKNGLPGSRPSSPERDVVRESTLYPVTLNVETKLHHINDKKI